MKNMIKNVNRASWPIFYKGLNYDVRDVANVDDDYPYFTLCKTCYFSDQIYVRINVL